MYFRSLLLVITILYVSLFAQIEETYLVNIDLSLYKDLNKLEELNLKVYYKDLNDLITVIDANQLRDLENKNLDFTLIDKNPVFDNYRIISANGNELDERATLFGHTLFQNSSIKVIKDYNLQPNNKYLSESELAKLSNNPGPFSNQKITKSSFASAMNDSAIFDIVSRINADSVAYIIQRLQDFETRFLMTNNRFDAAQWIKERFIQIGFTEVKFDSFMCHTIWQGIDTTTLQINVLATIEGVERPGEVYIIGGHYDSYCYDDPFTWAPGADDDASGTAAVLESARVIMESGYKPEATLKFICFGAEELMYFGDAGSEHYAQQAYNSGMDIKLMVNNDMISHTLDSVNSSTVDINYYLEFMDMLEIAKSSTQQYTSITPVNGSVNSGADSWPFYYYGFRPIYFEETNFSPYYHLPSDTIGNYNMEYCAEVIKASCATLITTMIIPGMVRNYKLVDTGTGNSLMLSWSPNNEPDVLGYKVRIGTSSVIYDSIYTTSDTLYLISELVEGVQYFVAVSAFDDEGNESVLVERNCVPLSIPLTPSGFTASPEWHQVILSWFANLEFDLKGYNIYRSDIEGELGDKLNSNAYIDTFYIDNSVESGTFYYYTITAVDSQLNESEYSETVRSRAVSLDQGILLVDETKNGDGSPLNPTDEQVDQFYRDLLSSFSIDEYDIEEEGNLGLAELGAYSTIIWHGDDYIEMIAPYECKQSIADYLDYGGNFLYSGFKPSRAFEQVIGLHADFNEGDFIFDYLKIEESNSTIFALFSGANGSDLNYINLMVDSSKTIESEQFHLKNIEVITPSNEGDLIYLYDSEFDSTSLQGVLKGRPVGVEHLISDFKTITFTFPLYYIQFPETKSLMEYIMTDKFNEVMSINTTQLDVPSEYLLIQNYPNPFNPVTTIKFSIPKEVQVNLSVFNILGEKIKELKNEMMKPGYYEVEFYASSLASGIYLYRIKTGEFVATKKMVLMK